MSKSKDIPDGVKNEAQKSFESKHTYFFQEYHNLPTLANIPTTVIISYNKPIERYEEEMNKNLKLGINIKSWWREYDQLRIRHFSDLISNNDNSRLILLPKYSHGIHFQNPELVAKLILENFNANRKKNRIKTEELKYHTLEEIKY
ncbi:hypothetical protein [Chryseobacterium wanjuense]